MRRLVKLRTCWLGRRRGAPGFLTHGAPRVWAMAIDLAGFITYLKDHAVEHRFHVHDERHYIETYSLRQSWEVDLHPESACDGPLDLHLACDVEPRLLLELDDKMADMRDEFTEPEGEKYRMPLFFNWALPSLQAPPDLLILATDLAAVGGPDLPIEVSGVDSFGATDAPDRRLSLVGKVEVSLVDVMLGRVNVCETLDRCHEVSEFLLERSVAWMGEI